MPAGFVIVTAGTERAVLKAASRRGAAGQEVWVASGALSKVSNGDPLAVSPASVSDYRRYWLTRDPARQRALLGLLAGPAALIIKLALEVGKSFPLVVVGDAGVVVTNAVVTGLAIIGQLVTFWGVYTSTD